MKRLVHANRLYNSPLHYSVTQIAQPLQLSSCILFGVALLKVPHVDADTGFELGFLL